jgi:hypothetical protein
MHAAEVVLKVGNGVVAALDTCERFLGIEAFAYQNADIKPEYITTLKVAEALTDPSRVVKPEASMKELRRHAAAIGRLHGLNSRPTWSRIQEVLDEHIYGKERIDVRVDEASGDGPPLLLVEAKLGVRNIKGVQKDIDRLVKLFDLYEGAGALNKHVMYGAVVFHAMQEQGTEDTLTDLSRNMFEHINKHLAAGRKARPKLYFQAGQLSATLRVEGISGDTEIHGDGTVEPVFGKHGYAFQAGLVLIGNAPDVTTVTL